MHIVCPHCQNLIDLAGQAPADEVLCPSCGLSFRLAREGSTEWAAPPGPRKLGKFDLRRVVGHGAFGTVYEAWDPELARVVALKVPRAGSLDSRQEHDRFQREGRSVAQLRHPGIVSVHQVGEEEGVPFLVSDFVEGVTLADLLTGRRPPPREAAALVERIARALQYAHEQGVVHRDVKPSNVMIDPAGEPHLMDFGLARRDAGEVTMTLDGQVLGTPAYMSPEQARGEGHRVDGRSDVYSLGVVLYQVLTGELPFRGNTRMLLHQVLNDEPRSLRSLNDRIPRDLETIALKAMAKEPARRYATAGDLADDLERFRKGEPIRARPVRAAEKVWRWCRHNPLAAGLAAALLLTLAAGFSGLILKWQAAEAEGVEARELARYEEEKREKAEEFGRRESHLREKAQKARAEADGARRAAEASLYFNRVALADRYRLAGNVARCEELLEVCPADLRRWEWYYLRRLCRAERLRLKTPGAVVHAAFRPDGRRLATVSRESDVTMWTNVTLWDTASGEALAVLPGLGDVHTLAWSPDGELLAGVNEEGIVRVWQGEPGRLAWKAQAHQGPARAVCFTPDGAVVMTAGDDGLVRRWRARTGRALGACAGYRGPGVVAAFSPDGKRLAAVCGWPASHPLRQHGQALGAALVAVTAPPLGRLTVAARATPLPDTRGDVVLCELESGRFLTLPGHAGKVVTLAFSADGQRLATAGEHQAVRIWNTRDGTVRARWAAPAQPVRRLAFRPDGQALAAGCPDGSVLVWQPDTGLPVLDLKGHARAVTALVYDSRGRRLASGSEDQTARVWDGHNGGQGLRRPGRQVLAFAPDGRWYATLSVGRPERVVLARPDGGEVRTLAGHKAEVLAVAFSPDGKRVATVGADRSLRLWDRATGREELRVGLKVPPGKRIAFSRDGRLLAVGSQDQTVTVWETGAGRLKGTLRPLAGEVRGLAFDPDGRRLVTACTTGESGEFKVWDLGTGREERVWFGHTAAVEAMVGSPAGPHVASAGADGRVIVWDPATGEAVHTLEGHSTAVRGVAYSSDGGRLVSAGEEVKVWYAASGQEVLAIRSDAAAVAFSGDGHYLAALANAAGPDALVFWDGRPDRSRLTIRNAGQNVALSGDGRWLLSAGLDSHARLWDARTGRLIRLLKGHTELVRRAVFSPDGRLAATAGEDRTVRLWEVQTGKEVQTLRGHAAWVNALAFSGDGRFLASAGYDRAVLVWEVAGGKRLAHLPHPDRVLCVAFAPGPAATLATGGDDNTVTLWDFRRAEKVHLCTGHTDSVNGLAFAPEGDVLASASDDMTVRLWHVRTGREVRTLRGHTDQVRDVAFSPDGRVLASAGWEGVVRLWEPGRGDWLLSLHGGDEGVRSVALGPAGQLAAAGADLSLRTWDVADLSGPRR